MMPTGMGGGNLTASYKLFITCMVIVIMMPMFCDAYIQMNVDDDDFEYQSQLDQLNDGYASFTGQSVANTTSVWALTGIYTPYQSNASYGWTDDGWLYGTRVSGYTPSQYSTGSSTNSVTYDNGFYYYNADTNDGHKQGDLYTSVTMSANYKSDIFFTENGRTDAERGFYYQYSGYRYAFQPIGAEDIINQDGESVPIVSTTTSLSLIWYEYYYGSSSGASGIAGQLIISGNDSGVSYLTGQNIVSAFNSATNTASFNMTFNGGIPVTLHIRIDPTKTAMGYSVQTCYDNGWWSLMVTSKSTDPNAYISTDYSFNIYSIFETMIALFTFNLDDYYGIDDTSALMMSLVMTVMLYAGLIALGLEYYPVLIVAGILAVIQVITSCLESITAFFSNWDLVMQTVNNILPNILDIIGGIL